MAGSCHWQAGPDCWYPLLCGPHDQVTALAALSQHLFISTDGLAWLAATMGKLGLIVGLLCFVVLMIR